MPVYRSRTTTHGRVWRYLRFCGVRPVKDGDWNQTDYRCRQFVHTVRAGSRASQRFGTVSRAKLKRLAVWRKEFNDCG